MASTAIVWLRRDLRLHDHPALHRAVRDHDRVVPVFVLDDRLLEGRFASAPRTAFMLGCLRALGPALVVRHGRPEREIPALAAELDADAVLWTSDVSPFARRRDARVTQALRAAGVEALPQGGNYIADVGKIETKTGRPYTVFSPFHRTWRDLARRPVHRAVELEAGGVRSDGLPDEAGGELAFAPGEPAARKALAAWLADGVDGYDGEGRTSELSPYLRWGCLSPRECEERALRRGGDGAAAWVRQLCWRDFFAHVLLHDTPSKPNPSWERDDGHLAAWQEGRTGYPLVDAGMRQLAATGWMHNRARLVTGSFLTKDLHIDWRLGELHFERLLLDAEPAQNNGNWQWIASVGVDPAPAFRRMFNPTLQAQKFDPDGSYIRRWVSELDEVDDADVHDPPPLVRAACGYPEPIVDHAAERRRALERYAAAT
ncbi:MAG: cryptochrome/photolyase family protein [Solirubrobacteraceae bacterium]